MAETSLGRDILMAVVGAVVSLSVVEGGKALITRNETQDERRYTQQRETLTRVDAVIDKCVHAIGMRQEANAALLRHETSAQRRWKESDDSLLTCAESLGAEHVRDGPALRMLVGAPADSVFGVLVEHAARYRARRQLAGLHDVIDQATLVDEMRRFERDLGWSVASGTRYPPPIPRGPQAASSGK
jgi:hypothetical protein